MRSARSRRATPGRSLHCSIATRASSRRAARTATTCSAWRPSTECGRRDKASVRELLARGADPNGANDRGWTALHQAGYANDGALARLLLEAGARTDLSAHGEGGTPLAAALFWGHREAGDLLAERGVAPLNLRIAAGLGRLELIRGFVARTGA